MKPIVLKVSGLHSFREAQEVRFDALSEAGVFGIFGPTGSGKSSILDAITLALYGTVGRAEHNTRGILNHGEKTLSVSFEFEVGGHQPIRYRAERSYRRKDDVAVQNVRSRFVECREEGDIVLADKDSDVTTSVKQTLGLEPEDFTRAVVLPQGKFAEFLNLKGVDRNKMLQRLFSLERFGDGLQHRTKVRLDAADRELERITAEQQGIGDASVEALAEAEQQLVNARRQETEVKQRRDKAVSDDKRLAKLWERQAELVAVERDIAQHGLQENHIGVLSQSIAAAQRANLLMPVLEAHRDAQAEMISAERHFSQCEQAWLEATDKYSHAQAALDAAKHTLAEEDPRLQERVTVLERAVNIEQQVAAESKEVADVRARRNTLIAEQDKIDNAVSAAEQRLKELESKLGTLSVEVAARKISGEARHRVYQLGQQLTAYQAAAEEDRAAERERGEVQVKATSAAERAAQAQLQFTEVQRQEEELAASSVALAARRPAEEGELQTALLRLQALRPHAHRYTMLSSQMVALKETFHSLEKELSQAKAAYSTAVLERETTQAHLDELLRAREESLLATAAVALAETLAEGVPCPVCGSAHHPGPVRHDHPSVGVNTVERERMDEEVGVCQRTLAERAEAVHRLERELVMLESTHKAKADALAQADADLAELLGEIRRIAPDAHVSDADALAQWIQTNADDATQQQALFARWQAETQAITERQATLQTVRQSAETALAVANSQHTAAMEALQRADAQLGKASEKKSEAQQQLREALDQVAGAPTTRSARELRSWLETQLQSFTESDAFVEDAARTEQALRAEMRSVTEQLNEYRRELSGLASSRAELEGYLKKADLQLAELRAQVEENVGSQASALVALNEVQQQRVALQTALTTAEGAYEEQRTAYQNSEQTLAVAKNRLERTAADEAKRRGLLLERLAELQFVTAEAALDACLTPEELEARRRQVEQYTERTKYLETQAAHLRVEVGDQHVSEADFASAQEALRDAERAWMDAVGAVGAAERVVTELTARHDKWCLLEEKRKQVVDVHGKLSHLRQVLSGNKFVEFVAQEQMEFVARNASDKLKQLTRNRYALEVAADGRFVMRDDFNGGVRRPVGTLSGGETFITSLALALSLSTQIQLRGRYPLQFFFLDEGFGTLDTELLDVVMSTLEKLHLDNMTIGIISHVPELRQRLQRRLIVEPPEAAGRGTRVHMEMA